MPIFGLTPDQLLTLAGVGLALAALLLVVKLVFKLTVSCLKLGCLAILIILLIVFASMLFG